MTGYDEGTTAGVSRRNVLRAGAVLGTVGAFGVTGTSSVLAGGTSYNDANRNAGRPHFNIVDVTGWEVTLEFVNPHTGWPWAWDVRVDGAAGTDDDWTGQTISQGPLSGEDFGQAYDRVSLGPADETVTETVTYQATELVEVIMRRGSEQSWYVPWVQIEPEQAESRADCMDGGYADFGFRNQGQCVRFVNTGQDSR